MLRIIHIKNKKQLVSQTIKTQIKRFLKRRGKLADVKLVPEFKVQPNVSAFLEKVKKEAQAEFKAGIKIPKYR